MKNGIAFHMCIINQIYTRSLMWVLRHYKSHKIRASQVNGHGPLCYIEGKIRIKESLFKIDNFIIDPQVTSV